MSNGELIAAGVGALALAGLVWRLFGRRPPPAWTELTVCSSCGWKGRTSRYAGRCPRCNTPIGEQRAHRDRERVTAPPSPR